MEDELQRLIDRAFAEYVQADVIVLTDMEIDHERDTTVPFGVELCEKS